jgi:hypothetical protein
LNVSDYQDAEAAVEDQFSVQQQAIIVKGADDPALVVYALGKNPKKASELANIEDHVDFAFAVARLEAGMKVGKRKKASRPEKTVRSDGNTTGIVDSTLERLRAASQRDNDISKVLEMRRKQRRQSRK